MVKPVVANLKAVDFSFMPSLQCDLSCGHCMYNSSPTNLAVLDFDDTKTFVATIDWNYINSCGFYGGELGINIPMYERFMALVPRDVPKFTITDGTWSRTPGRTRKFVEFAERNDLQVFVSTTKYHTPFQNAGRLAEICEEYDRFTSKDGEEELIPMGRLATKDWSCGFRCMEDRGPVRFALQPGGTIIFQSCDGVYPVVGTVDQTFSHIMGVYGRIVERCQQMRKNVQ